MVFTWMADNKTSKWTAGLHLIQFMKNRSYHSGIKRSPYEAMFGTLPRVGLEQTSLLREVWPQIEGEDDLRETMEGLNDPQFSESDDESEMLHDEPAVPATQPDDSERVTPKRR